MLSLCLIAGAPLSAQQKVTIGVDAGSIVGEMTPIWSWFGYDEPNYTYMKDGRKLLTELSKLSDNPVYIRVHNLMCTGNGEAALKWGSTNIYTEDADGNPVYSWDIVDRIFDTFIDRGLRPLVQFGFMPEALSSNPDPYRHWWQPGRPMREVFTGWRFPPKDYDKWRNLVTAWVTHMVDRYGKDLLDTWYWELWNEPDIAYWGGTVEEYCKLYDYTVAGLTAILPEAKIGGPHVTCPQDVGPRAGASEEFMRFFLQHCIDGKNYVTGKKGSKLDFIAFHAKGAPVFRDGHVIMDMGRQLSCITRGAEIINSFPSLKHLPVIIGESDPEGCAACGMTTNPSNGYRNGTLYSSYTASSFARKYRISDNTGMNLIGAVSWSFLFEDQPWFHGFRDLATNGVDKPVLNVFRMFGKMKGDRVEVTGGTGYDYASIISGGVRGIPDVDALAALSPNSLMVMVWHYHDVDLPAQPVMVELDIKSIPARSATLCRFLIDRDHSNSYEVWKSMNSPQNPTPEQIAILKNAGQLEQTDTPRTIAISNGNDKQRFELQRQGVTLLQYVW